MHVYTQPKFDCIHRILLWWRKCDYRINTLRLMTGRGYEMLPSFGGNISSFLIICLSSYVSFLGCYKNAAVVTQDNLTGAIKEHHISILFIGQQGASVEESVQQKLRWFKLCELHAGRTGRKPHYSSSHCFGFTQFKLWTQPNRYILLAFLFVIDFHLSHPSQWNSSCSLLGEKPLLLSGEVPELYPRYFMQWNGCSTK